MIHKKLTFDKLWNALDLPGHQTAMHQKLLDMFSKMEKAGITLVASKQSIQFVDADKSVLYELMLAGEVIEIILEQGFLPYAAEIIEEQLSKAAAIVLDEGDQDISAKVVWTDKGTGPVDESPESAPCDVVVLDSQPPTLTDMFSDQADEDQLEESTVSPEQPKPKQIKPKSKPKPEYKVTAQPGKKDTFSATPTLGAVIGKFKAPEPKEAMKMDQVQLVDATVMYQPVNGTSGSSTYHCVGIAGQFKFAARRKGTDLSIRVEGPVSDKTLALTNAGFNSEYIAKGYTSVHFHNLDAVMASRALGAVLAATNFEFDTPLPNLAQIDGAGS